MEKIYCGVGREWIEPAAINKEDETKGTIAGICSKCEFPWSGNVRKYKGQMEVIIRNLRDLKNTSNGDNTDAEIVACMPRDDDFYQGLDNDWEPR